MKLKLPLLFFIVCHCFWGYSQTTVTKKDDVTRTEFTNAEINQLLDRYFMQFNTGQDNATSASFAGLDIQKTDVTFSPTFFDKKNNIWTVKFNGGITEGISSVFTNNKFNTNINLEVQYACQIRKSKIEFSFYQNVLFDYEKNLANERITALENFVKFMTANKPAIDAANATIYTTTKTTIETDVATAKNRIISNDYAGLNASIKNTLDTAILNLKGAVTADANLTLSISIKQNELGNSYAKKSKEEIKKIKLTATNHQWISFGAKVRNDAFKLLDRTAVFEDQVTKKDYVSYGGSILYNNYRYSLNDNSRFYNFGIRFINKSNYLLLDDVTVNEAALVGTEGNSGRQVTSTFTAYEGEYIKYINQIDLVADYYYFFNSKGIFGFHLYEVASFNKIIKPNYDAGIGLVLSIRNKDKENTIINGEVYYTFKDIAGNNTEINALESNEIGLRFTFPLNFNFN